MWIRDRFEIEVANYNRNVESACTMIKNSFGRTDKGCTISEEEAVLLITTVTVRNDQKSKLKGICKKIKMKGK